LRAARYRRVGKGARFARRTHAANGGHKRAATVPVKPLVFWRRAFCPPYGPLLLTRLPQSPDSATAGSTSRAGALAAPACAGGDARSRALRAAALVQCRR